ncbi:MAG: anti-sigma factor [Ktedonobacteraceae bacterium]
MGCNKAQHLLDGYVDGELDLTSTLEIEQHLQACAECSHVYNNQLALRTAIGAGSLYFTPPVNLQKRIQVSLRKENKSKTVPRVIAWHWISIAATLAAVLLITLGLVYIWSVSSTDDHLTQDVLSSHVRSLMANHLVDVPSSDQHTVKPWFDGKLDFSPPVVDLAKQGFPLVGGRLDYLDNRPIAALVYQRRKHVINLFIWPTQNPDAGTKTVTRQGYELVSWTKSGMNYWAVSDLSTSELQQFVQLLQQQTPNEITLRSLNLLQNTATE